MFDAHRLPHTYGQGGMATWAEGMESSSSVLPPEVKVGESSTLWAPAPFLPDPSSPICGLAQL